MTANGIGRFDQWRFADRCLARRARHRLAARRAAPGGSPAPATGRVAPLRRHERVKLSWSADLASDALMRRWNVNSRRARQSVEMTRCRSAPPLAAFKPKFRETAASNKDIACSGSGPWARAGWSPRVSRSREISRLFHFEVDMISDNNDIALADRRQGDAEHQPGRRLDAACQWMREAFLRRRRRPQGRRNYRAELVPWLWFLTRTADCGCFKDKTADHPACRMPDSATIPSSWAAPKRTYCVSTARRTSLSSPG